MMLWWVVSALAMHIVGVTSLIVLNLLVILSLGILQSTRTSEQYHCHIVVAEQNTALGRAGGLYMECPLGHSLSGKVA